MSSTHIPGSAVREPLLPAGLTGGGAIGGTAGLMVLTLAATGLLEVLLYRVLRPLVAFDGPSLPAWVQPAVLAGASYTVNLTWVLGLLGVCVLLVEMVRHGPGASGGAGEGRGGRLLSGAIGGLFVASAAIAGLAPAWAEAHGLSGARLFGAFGCVAVLTTLSTLPLRADGRFKLGMVLLLVPLALQLYVFTTAARGEGFTAPLADVLLYGQGAAIAVAALLPLCFAPPWDPREGAGAAVIAALVCAVAGGLIWLDWQTASQIVQNMGGVRLPLGRAGQAGLLLGLGGGTFATVALLLRGGWFRMRGLGLLLIGLAGYQLQDGQRMALFLAGMLCVARTSEA